jgi:hypothetical protein
MPQPSLHRLLDVEQTDEINVEVLDCYITYDRAYQTPPRHRAGRRAEVSEGLNVDDVVSG